MQRVFPMFGLLLGLLFTVGCGGSSNLKYQRDQVTFNGDARKYAVYTPVGYDTGRKYPTILFLHGLFEGGSGGTAQTGVGIGPAIAANPERWNCIVVMPQSPDNWLTDSSVQLANAVVDDAMKKYAIDPNRIVVTGLSNGGGGTWLLGAKYPGKFAALAPLCGYSAYEAVPNLTRIPVWAIHNDIDPFVSPGGTKEMVERINKAGGSAQITIYPDSGHDCWAKAYTDLRFVAWLQSQSRRMN